MQGEPVVEYYVLNPESGRMVRKRIRLGRLLKRCSNKQERKNAAVRICEEINRKLRGGWSPLHESDMSRLYTPLSALRDRFLSAKEAEGCRSSTLVQYGSVINLWLRWCEDYGFGGMYSGTFLRQHAVQYMDYCMELRNRHRSYNNTIKVLKAFFEWAKEHCYAKENPFSNIKMLKKEQKIRVLMDRDSREKVDQYYQKEKPAMQIVCRLVYSSAIRPAEILRVKVEDVNLEEHYILIRGENAKNHHERYAALTPELVDLLKPHLDPPPCPSLVGRGAKEMVRGDMYLFGRNENLAPGYVQNTTQYFQKSWARMREATGLPVEMQMYSLRDSGITDLLHAGVDQLTVQHHADHSSLAMQEIYTKHRDDGVGQAIWEKGPQF